MDTRAVPPPWRERVERLTRLAIGFGAQTLPSPDPSPEITTRAADGAGTAAIDIALGAFSRSQSFVLDATERVVAVGTAVARVPVVASVTSGAAHAAGRALESTRVRGQILRVRAVREVRTDLPEYAGRAVTRAVDVIPLNQILEKVDLDALLQRIDLAAMLDRVDLNGVVTKIDLDALVARTDLGAVIAQSTGGMASGAVDLVRRQGVGLDELVASFATRIRQRALRDSPPGPPLLAGQQGSA
jgi:hypothetical protein